MKTYPMYDVVVWNWEDGGFWQVEKSFDTYEQAVAYKESIEKRRYAVEIQYPAWLDD